MHFKTLLSAVTIVVSGFASAAEIDAVFHYPAGGGVDSSTAPLWDAIEETSDIKVNRVYYKSCAEAFEHVINTPNSLLASESTSMNLEGSSKRCPDVPSSGIELISIVSTAGGYLCTSPEHNSIKIEDLVNGGEYKIAAIKNVLASGAISSYLNSINNDSKVIPYANGAEMRSGITAGDVDLFYTINMIDPFVEAGAVCLAGSNSNNLRGVPSLGEAANSDFPEYAFSVAIYAKEVSDEITESIRKAMKSESFNARIAERKMEHLGLGADKDVADQKQFLIDSYNSLSTFE